MGYSTLLLEDALWTGHTSVGGISRSRRAYDGEFITKSCVESMSWSISLDYAREQVEGERGGRVASATTKTRAA